VSKKKNLQEETMDEVPLAEAQVSAWWNQGENTRRKIHGFQSFLLRNTKLSLLWMT
jgi:sRNA-binding regulator protein Hfq